LTSQSGSARLEHGEPDHREEEKEMADTVTSQLRAAKPKAATAKPPAKPVATAKPRRAAKPATKPAETPKPAETKPEISPEEKLRLKEERKKAAFAKLKERAAAKREANAVARTETVKSLRKELKKGQRMYSTRASYYGVLCEVLDIIEVRGRVLIEVRCLTTKKGRELEKENTYLRRFSPKFLQPEAPTEKYVPRRPSEAHNGTETVEPEDAEAPEDEVEEAEDESEEEEEEDETEDESDEDESEVAEDSTDDSEDEEEEDDSETDEDDESWG
jgi:midasin (ATPase involved in ribosome maturation)